MKQNYHNSQFTIHNSNQKGMVVPLVLVAASVFIIFGVSLISWSITGHKETIRKVRQTQSLQVAEAGVNYYKWHLAHNSSDYKDGNAWCCGDPDPNPALTLDDCGGICGPYVHDYENYERDAIIGQFSLMITPSETGSTINTIESTGHAYGSSSIRKKISVLVGKRSLAEYSFLTHSPIWIGSDEATSGPLHSNSGIRFDDTCNAEVTSAVLTYSCDGVGHGCSGTKPGIWGSGGPTTLWRFPVSPIDFSLFTVNLANIKTDALDGGTYFGGNAGVCGNGVCGIMEDKFSCSADCPNQCGNGNCQGSETYDTCPNDCPIEGYLVRFNSGGTFNVYKINSLKDQVWYYNFELGSWQQEAEEISDGPSVLEQVGGDYDIPANGVIFIEDDVWVDGIVNGKVTVAAARLDGESDFARIRINNNIKYPDGERYDGTNVLGLIAQGDILVPRYAPNDLTIDATLLSQNGHVFYRYYSPHSIKSKIEVYGGVITNLFWTWTWVSWNGSEYVTVDGYDETSTIYNNNLTFAPPPSFPTSENFEVLKWSEE
ncbi:MAG: hypothetical protein U9N04_03030 [Patescibacteria group bacterium]|nr:hypothetical protein [Patescibacteria group bacterium]